MTDYEPFQYSACLREVLAPYVAEIGGATPMMLAQTCRAWRETIACVIEGVIHGEEHARRVATSVRRLCEDRQYLYLASAAYDGDDINDCMADAYKSGSDVFDVRLARLGLLRAENGLAAYAPFEASIAALRMQPAEIAPTHDLVWRSASDEEALAAIRPRKVSRRQLLFADALASATHAASLRIAIKVAARRGWPKTAGQLSAMFWAATNTAFRNDEICDIALVSRDWGTASTIASELGGAVKPDIEAAWNDLQTAALRRDVFAAAFALKDENRPKLAIAVRTACEDDNLRNFVRIINRAIGWDLDVAQCLLGDAIIAAKSPRILSAVVEALKFIGRDNYHVLLHRNSYFRANSHLGTVIDQLIASGAVII